MTISEETYKPLDGTKATIEEQERHIQDLLEAVVCCRDKNSDEAEREEMGGLV